MSLLNLFFSHLISINDLSFRSGLFPSRLRSLPPKTVCISSTIRIRSLNWQSTTLWEAKYQISALPLIDIVLHTVPKYFSKITSYIPVRLAFHLYSQVIQPYCNRDWFDPPLKINLASICSWIDHLVSGPYSLDDRPIKTRFHYDFHLCLINILANPLYKRYHIVSFKLCVLFNFRFQILFHCALLSVFSEENRSFQLSLTLLVHYRSFTHI